MSNKPAPPKAAWELALDQALEIQRMIDEDIDDDSSERGSDFLNDVRDNVAEMGAAIERTRSVSERQKKALDNWQSGVEAWVH